MCLARREGSEGLICPADTSMTTRSSSWGGQRSGTCLGCTPCELAPPPAPIPVGVLLVWPWSLGPTPRRPRCGSSESLLRDTECTAARGHPESVGHRLQLHVRPQPHPRGQRWAPGPPAWVRAQGSSGSGSVHQAGLLSRGGRMAPGLGCPVWKVPAVILGETRCPAPGSPPQPELPQKHAGRCSETGWVPRASPGPGWTELTWPPGRLPPPRPEGLVSLAEGRGHPWMPTSPSGQWRWVGGPRMLTLPSGQWRWVGGPWMLTLPSGQWQWVGGPQMLTLPSGQWCSAPSSLNGATNIQEFPDLRGTTSLETL